MKLDPTKTAAINSPLNFVKMVLGPFKWTIVVLFILPVAISFYDFGVSYAIKRLIDAFSLEPFLINEVYIAIYYFVATQILVGLFWRIDDILMIKIQPKIRTKIIEYSFNYTQNHNYAFFLEAPAGSITSKIKSLVDRFDDVFSVVHYNFTTLISTCIISSSMMALVSVKICAFFILMMMIYALFSAFFSRPLTQLSKAYSDNYHKIFAKVSDSVSNIFAVKAFSNESFEFSRLKTFIKDLFVPSLIKAYWLEFKANIVSTSIYTVMLVGMFLLMVRLRLAKEISNGDIAYLIGLATSVSNRLYDASRAAEQVFKNIGDFKSAFSILQIPQERDDHLPDLIIKRPTIKFSKVSFKYPKNPKVVFNQLNLTIKPGEKVGIVGRSGAGKTSLVSLINKYFQPLKGTIYIDNQDINGVNAASLRKLVALIPQECMLFHRTIMENIRYGKLDASDEEVFEAARRANLHNFILSLSQGYETEVGERGVKLSGGQKQRIAIARAILKRAPILILDEATASLDTETERLIQSSLEHLFASQTTTIIAIAHRLSTLKNMDRILVMDQGMIVEQGSHAELLSKPNSLYRRLWELQQI